MALMRRHAVARSGRAYVKGPRQPEGGAASKTDLAPEEAGPGRRTFSSLGSLEREPGVEANHARQLVVVRQQEARVLHCGRGRRPEVDPAGIEVRLAEHDGLP